MKLVFVVLAFACLFVSFTSYGQESEYYTMEEIQDMRKRLEDLGYEEDFIKKSLEPYMAKASIDLEKTTFKGYYNKKYQQLIISNCSEVEGEMYCAKYLKINGKKVDVYCTTFHLVYNLRPLDLELGSEVVIEIFHTKGCLPLVTNTEDFKKQN